MSPIRWIAIAVLAIAPLAAIAQDKPKQPDPTSPVEPAAELVYESALRDYQAYTEPKESPAKVWRAANDEMGRVGGHMGQIKEDATPADHSTHYKKKGK